MKRTTIALIGAAMLASACTSTTDASDSARTVAPAAAKTDPAALEGRWLLETIDGVPVSQPENRPADAEPATLTFQDGRIGAYVFCNRMGGDYVAAPGTLETGTVMSTLMACEGGMQQEAAVGNILRTVKTFEITPGGTLVLTSIDGLTLEARR